MASSSPYAAFRAEEWMRDSVIRPRKVFSEPRPVPVRSSRRRQAAVQPTSRCVQGELFLFPVVVAC